MKRGQAALEFLTTYGWAFLVIIVMIGALAYFGVLNPSNLLPERCTFSTELPCQDAQITASTGKVEFYIQNNLGNTAILTRINATFADTGVAVTCTNSSEGPISPSHPLVIAPSASSPILCRFSDVTFQRGAKAKVFVAGNYSVTGGRYPKIFQGEIYGKVK